MQISYGDLSLPPTDDGSVFDRVLSNLSKIMKHVRTSILGIIIIDYFYSFDYKEINYSKS